MVATGSMRGNDPIALLIGEDAYVAAGGKVERDLFSDAGEDRLRLALLDDLSSGSGTGRASAQG